MFEPVFIVGAGQAAAQAIETLRRSGHRAPIVVFGDEAVLPYQRPPLSKKYLAGTLERERLLIRHAAHYQSHAVEVMLDSPVVRIDRAARSIEVADGSRFDYTRLLLATGARARRLAVPGADLAGVHLLRTTADVDRLREDCQPDRHCVVIGGGYLGLEVAGTCREMGLAVTVLEAESRVMSRAVAPEVSAFLESEHARHGVRILCDARVTGLRAGPQGRVASVLLADGREVEADVVLMAIGVEPADSLAREAGLPCDDGILVDEFCRTSDRAIWAAGDCTRHLNLRSGKRVRLESVDNAFEQGTTAALNMLGITTVHDKVPWFWSDQYDVKMVIVGLSAGHDERVLRGDPASRSFSVCYLRGGELIAVETVSHNKDQMAARKLIAVRARPDRARLADPSVALKDTV